MMSDHSESHSSSSVGDLSQSSHKVVAVTDVSGLDYSLFEPLSDLPVIDVDECLAVCDDWSFVVELLNDVLSERDVRIPALQAALNANDHTEFHKAAHAIKGAALNMRLPALVDSSKKCELIGKQLELPQFRNDQQLLQMRQRVINKLKEEYQRLEDYIPIAEQQAEAENKQGNKQQLGEEEEEEEEEEERTEEFSDEQIEDQVEEDFQQQHQQQQQQPQQQQQYPYHQRQPQQQQQQQRR